LWPNSIHAAPSKEIKPMNYCCLSKNDMTCVFMFLPYYELLQMSLVCKTWHDAVFSKKVWERANIDSFVYYMALESFWLFVEKLCRTGVLDCVKQLERSLFREELDFKRRELIVKLNTNKM
jgi:hypothetical protein